LLARAETEEIGRVVDDELGAVLQRVCVVDDLHEAVLGNLLAFKMLVDSAAGHAPVVAEGAFKTSIGDNALVTVGVGRVG